MKIALCMGYSKNNAGNGNFVKINTEDEIMEEGWF